MLLEIFTAAGIGTQVVPDGDARHEPRTRRAACNAGNWISRPSTACTASELLDRYASR